MRIKISDLINSLILIVLLLLTFSLFEHNHFVKYSYIFFSLVSIFLLIYQLWFLTHRCHIQIISTISIFIILCYLFNFGNFYLKFFKKENFYIYFSDWFSTDIFIKARVGWFSLCLIQAIFIGICFFLNDKESVGNIDYRCFISYSDESKKKAIYFSGVIIFIISAPCRLYWDIQQILMSSTGNGYIGGYSSVGLIDDIGVLLTPSIICIMYSKREKKILCKTIIILFLIYNFLIITLSGARRAYITSLLGVFVFYHDYFSNSQRKKYRFIKILLISLLVIVVLNFMVLIRDGRHSELSFSNILSGKLDSLFSLDFIWNTFGEFGITGIPTYYAYKYIPMQVPFFYGLNLLMSFIYILPIGWIVDYRFATTTLNNQIHLNGIYTHTGLGSSIICEMYCDFGWVSLIIGLLAGYYLAKLGFTKNNNLDNYSIKTVIRYCLGIIIINYARGSTSEVIRSGSYIIISIFLICCLYFSIYRKKASVF